MKKYARHIALVTIMVLAIANGYLVYEVIKMDTKYASLESLFNAEMDRFYLEKASTTEAIELKNATILELADELNLTSEELEDTDRKLRREEDRNDEMEEQIDDLADTVSDLDKLSKTDEELLQKYSKVYFLNEHYIPPSLKEIAPKWKYSEDKANQLHNKVMPFFEKMVEAAKADDVDLWVVSAYRSFGTQASLKGSYSVTYGSGANTFSADQGFSEHQLGTTIDFTTNNLGGGLDGFGTTAAYTWLLKNAHKYGFVLSYPQNNAYYVFEPWHWRFVGEDLASDLNTSNAHFYDWDQREIDKYLISIFD